MFSPYETRAGPGNASNFASTETGVRGPALPTPTATRPTTKTAHASADRRRPNPIPTPPISPGRPPHGAAYHDTQHDAGANRPAGDGGCGRDGATMRLPCDVTEWLGRGLQSLVQRFESARRLLSAFEPALG